jgi:hypothetical protein
MRAPITIKRAPLGFAAFIAIAALPACGSEELGAGDSEAVGEVEVALTNTPSDVSCLRITVEGARTDVRKFPLTEGENAVFQLGGLPVGNAAFTGEAFSMACNKVTSSAEPTWFSEPTVARVRTTSRTHVALAMIHNGKASVGVDFDEENGPDAEPDPELPPGFETAVGTYMVPVESGIETKPLISVGESVNAKPDGVTPYRVVGIADGQGVYDNGDDTFTLLSNHEIGNTNGIVRLHGGAGAFVSKWTIRKVDLAVLKGEDLIQTVLAWNPTTSAYEPTATKAFGRFCAGELAAESAFYDAESGKGYEGRLFTNGEEIGDEGGAWIHSLDGTTWEFPGMGNASWENVVPNPGTGATTIAVGIDDSGGGQVYIYAGEKMASGTPIEKAGLTGGTLYGLKVPGAALENAATGIADGPFEVHSFGDVSSWTGAQLQTASVANGVTGFQRPEDGAWDPNNPNHFYFVSTASFSTASRLWRLSFVDASQPALGGEIEMLLDGSEGQRMMDNLEIDKSGHVYIQEDPGGNNHLAKIWRYDIATGAFSIIAQHNPTYFDPASATLITIDEESSGIVNASDILGPGWFLLNVQAHRANPDAELVQEGQFLALFDPKSAG